MKFTDLVIEAVIVTAIALAWAKLAKLDLGLTAPAFGKAEPWVLIYILWLTAEWALFLFVPFEVDQEWLEQINQLSRAEDFVAAVLLAPVVEELLFRGVLFTALLRRWGIKAAAVVPSILWALLHTQYEWWVVALIAGSGVVLAMVRWTGGSLLLPIGLHAAGNLAVTLRSWMD